MTNILYSFFMPIYYINNTITCKEVIYKNNLCSTCLRILFNIQLLYICFPKSTVMIAKTTNMYLTKSSCSIMLICLLELIRQFPNNTFDNITEPTPTNIMASKLSHLLIYPAFKLPPQPTVHACLPDISEFCVLVIN